MIETNKKIFNLKDFLFRTLTDPVLWYTALIMTSLMYHYRDRDKTDKQEYLFAVGWGLAALVVGWLMFRIFDYIQKHHLLGFVIYIFLAVMFGYGVRVSIEAGAEDYPITWGLWFLTPQDSVEFNFGYTLGFYLLFMLFMGSVIYYFTRVRYRILMNFLIFIIPFAIYGKEYEKMPTAMIIMLGVGYILLMVYYRQLADTADTVFVGRRQSWKPIAVYAVTFSTIAAISPKPDIKADRSYLETLINADRLTDRLVAMLDVFRDTTSGQQFRNQNDNTVLYAVDAQENLRIKTAVYSTYDFKNDSWSVEDIDDYFGERVTSAPLNIGTSMGNADAFLKAARSDSDYAEKYGLEKYAESGLDEPEIRHAGFYTINNGNDRGADMAPVPQFAVQLEDCTREAEMTRLRGGTVYSIDTRFSPVEIFRFSYSADTFFQSPKNREFVSNLDGYDYSELLSDTYDVLSDELFYDDNFGNDEFLGIFDSLTLDKQFYDTYMIYNLEYGDNAGIKALADEITADCDTEYDKAQAIEAYFYNNDYDYDLNYKKKKGENVEDFLLKTKTGVCYEYATAMVMLARAAGIPARYCEGYNMTKRTDAPVIKGTDYVITPQDSHGFPELYIRGYGWMSFEPTVTDEVIEEKDSSAKYMLSRAGLFILEGALLILLFSFAYPWFSHKIFILRCRKRKPNDTVKAIVHRICRIYEIESANTSHEVGRLVYERSGADIADTVEFFDRAYYGDEMLDENEKTAAINEYIRAVEALKEAKKRKRKMRS